MKLLPRRAAAPRPETADAVAGRRLISVGWGTPVFLPPTLRMIAVPPAPAVIRLGDRQRQAA